MYYIYHVYIHPTTTPHPTGGSGETYISNIIHIYIYILCIYIDMCMSIYIYTFTYINNIFITYTYTPPPHPTPQGGAGRHTYIKTCGHTDICTDTHDHDHLGGGGEGGLPGLCHIYIYIYIHIGWIILHNLDVCIIHMIRNLKVRYGLYIPQKFGIWIRKMDELEWNMVNFKSIALFHTPTWVEYE